MNRSHHAGLDNKQSEINGRPPRNREILISQVYQHKVQVDKRLKSWKGTINVAQENTGYQSPLLLICGFIFCGFRYLQSTVVQNYSMENFRNKQFRHFKLYTLLSSGINSHAIPSKMRMVLLSSVSMLYTLPTHKPLSGDLSRSTVTVLQCLCSSNSNPCIARRGMLLPSAYIIYPTSSYHTGIGSAHMVQRDSLRETSGT